MLLLVLEGTGSDTGLTLVLLVKFRAACDGACGVDGLVEGGGSEA